MKRFAEFIAILLMFCAFPAGAKESDPTAAGDGFVTPRLEKTIPLDATLFYDRDLPLEVEMDLREETDAYKKYYLKYMSVNNQKIPALYIVPKGEGPFPAILFMGGQGGSMNAVMPFAKQFTKEGFALLSPEPQYHGERKMPNREYLSRYVFTHIEANRQIVLDYRRGLDFLETRPEINQDAIIYMGGSMGGILGGVIAGVDTRIDAAVLSVAGGSWTRLARGNVDPKAPEIINWKDERGLSWDDLQLLFDPIDPVNYIGRISPRPLLMINGNFDVLVYPKAAKYLYSKANEPKEIWWVDEGHILNYDALFDRTMEWLRKAVPALGDNGVIAE